MLELKPHLSTFLKCELKNGNVTAFWWDSWTSLGPLIDFVGPSGPRMLRLPLNAKVAYATRGGNWSLPSARSDAAQTLQILLTTMPVPRRDDGPDVFLWRSPSGNYSKSFSSRGTWDQIRVVSPMVQWSKIVWFKEAIPRASFILWLAIRQRLPTRDKLFSCGMDVPVVCPLCLVDQESHEHLFLACPFSEALWQAFAAPVYGQTPPSLMSEILDSLKLHAVSAPRQITTILRLLLQVIIYALWRESNSRIFTATTVPISALRGKRRR